MIDWNKPIKFADDQHEKVAGSPKFIAKGKNPGGYDCIIVSVGGAKTYYNEDGTLFGWCEEMRDGTRNGWDYKLTNV